MRLSGFLGMLTISLLMVISCQREYSLENAKPGSSSGSLKSLSGDCMPSGSNGIFKKGKAVDSSNYIYVDIDVYVVGSYVLVADKVNGVSFKGDGFFEATGIQTVRLWASGTPLTNGTVPYSVKYGGQKCIINVFAIN